MATRFAVATGNWSNPAIWDDGIGPVPGDNVYANGFTVTIDQNVNVGSIRNDASPLRFLTTATPPMTTNTTPSGVASIVYNGGTAPIFIDAWKAFDQDNSTSVQIGFNNSTTPSGFKYQFTSGKVIKRYYFNVYNQSSYLPTNWTFQGSNDDTNWTTLDTVTGNSVAVFTSNVLANTTSYLYYRIAITGTNGNNSIFFEFQMTESSALLYGNNAGGSFTLNGGYTVTCTNSLVPNTPTLINYVGTTGNTSVINSYTTSITATSATAISHNGTGALTINGNIVSSSTTNNANGVNMTVSGGTLTVNGNVTANSSASISSVGISVQAASTTLNINGNTTVVGNSNSFSCGIINNSANVTINILGDVTGCNNNGINQARQCGLYSLTDTGSVYTIIGNVYGGGNSNVPQGAYQCGVFITSATLNITGNVTGGFGTGSGGNALAYGIFINAAATVNITGNVTGGLNNTSVNYGIGAASTATINITGRCIATATYAVAISSAATLNITGVCTASNSVPAVLSSSTSANNTFTGPFVSNTNVMAVQVAKLLLTTTPTYWRMQSDARTMYTADYAPDYPSTLNVRSGVSYNGGLMTGTMIVPAANTVATGVPVDNTVGTAANSATAVQDAVWGKLTSTMTTSGSIGERVKNGLTQDTLGNLLTSL